MRKRIVYLTGTLRIGGAQQQVVDTAAGLNRQFFDPKVYAVFGGGPLYAYALERGVDVTVFAQLSERESDERAIPCKRSRQLYALWRYLRREQPDIVHCYLYKPALYGGIATRLLKKRPIFMTSRRSLGCFKDTKPHFQVLENVVNRFTDCVVANSREVKQDTLEREALLPDNVVVIYNGVDTRRYKPVAETERATIGLEKHKLGIPAASPVFGMVANLFAYKGYQEFIRAAAMVHRTFPEARYVCIGQDCGLQSQLETLSSELGIKECVIFTGQVKDISKILPLIDIQVSASHEEGFSNAILEGMACGKPIIATAVGGTPEAVVDGETGILVAPKNSEALARAMKQLLENPELAAIFGKNGRRRIETVFSMNTMLQAFEQLYRDLLE